LFRELGQDDKADELLDIYMQVRGDEPDLFNLKDYAFSGDISDQKVRETFDKAYEDSVVEETPHEVLQRLAEQDGWNQKDEIVLAATTPEEYYDLFKAERGEHLSRFVNTCLKFGQFANSSERQKKIADNAKEALARIGMESAINKRRVRKFGIKIDDCT
jgi:hypothetical protein